ncbi:MAG: HNH endonuclease [Planctomycetes bacterium]|nr:HNH endonuclease [Planctomycetota bacterium]
MSDIGKELRRRVSEISQFRCSYCLARAELMGDQLQIDHIVPRTAGGKTVEENLCLACSSCNRFKGTRTRSIDPVSKRACPLFNPRKQDWHKHFRWNIDGTKIVGLTPVGRATISALRLNNPWIVRTREFWVRAKLHPPKN